MSSFPSKFIVKVNAFNISVETLHSFKYYIEVAVESRSTPICLTYESNDCMFIFINVFMNPDEFIKTYMRIISL